MTYKGINYDTGTRTLTGKVTRAGFEPDLVTREIEIIKQELHCNAIRITGFDIGRAVMASEIALRQGLTVWFSPFLQYENRENTLQFMIQAAIAAEKLRIEFSNVLLVAGCELSLFTGGFVKGDTGGERIKNLFGPISLLKNVIGIKRGYNRRLQKFLQEAVAAMRKHFKGPITYASGTWEKIDWELFDIVGIDHYRSSFNNTTYNKELEKYKGSEKPLSIMEFGCCTYKGAEDKGGMGWAIVDWKKDRPILKGEYVRDEEVQARTLLELLEVFEKEAVFAAFVFTFVTGNYIYDEDPAYDLDMASYGIVKVTGNGDEPAGPDERLRYRGLPWLPKRAFFEIGRYYGEH